jgi:hypothetical protein
MDIPTGLLGLAGVLAIPVWLALEWRGSRRLARIGLGLFCILAIALAASHSKSAPLYLHKQLLRQIDRAIEAGKAPRVRHAFARYGAAFDKTHDFVDAALAASDALYESRSVQELDGGPGRAPANAK